MKTIQIKFKTLLLLLLVGWAFTSCSKEDDSITDPDENSGGKDMVATIALESGNEIDFGSNFSNITGAKPTLIHEKGSDQSVLAIAGIMGNRSITITALINGEGDYSYTENFDEDDNETGATISFSRLKDDDMEFFAPFNLSDGTMGTVKLTITSLAENHIKATFSATLFSVKTSEKVTIKDGKIDSELDRREID